MPVADRPSGDNFGAAGVHIRPRRGVLRTTSAIANAKSTFIGMALAALLLAQSGCVVVPVGPPATFFSGNPNPCTNIDQAAGVLAGALVGYGLGRITHQKSGTTALMAGGGAMAGGLVGHAMDVRRCELYKIAQANQLQLGSEVVRAKDVVPQTDVSLPASSDTSTVGLNVHVLNQPDEFVPGTAELTPKAREYFQAIARQYTESAVQAASRGQSGSLSSQQLGDRKVLIVAHTDERDAAEGGDLAQLSQLRAQAIAQVFASVGVPAADIYYQGAGDSLPVASNATEDGRRLNQRVQIVDVPDQQSLQGFLSQRSADPANFVPAPSVAEPSSGPSPATTAMTPPPQNSVGEGPRSETPTTMTPEAGSPAASTASRSALNYKPSSGTAAVRLPARSRLALDSGYDFGGTPVVGSPPGISLQERPPESGFSFIRTARADTPVQLVSCVQDAPHQSTPVVNLESNQELAPRYYVTGFDSDVWASSLNGNYVAILNATIPLDTGAPIPAPQIVVYKNWHGDPHQSPSYQASVAPVVYRGIDAIVYRLFVNGPMRCLDLVVPLNRFSGSATVYYDRGPDALYRAGGGFSKRR